MAVEWRICAASKAVCLARGRLRPRSDYERGVGEFVDGPDMIGQAQGHGGRALLQRLMRAEKVIVQVPPLDMQAQVGLRLRQRPGFTGQRGDGLAQGEVEALDEGGLNAVRQTVDGL